MPKGFVVGNVWRPILYKFVKIPYNRIAIQIDVVFVRASDTLANRAIVSFDTCKITLKNGFVISLGFVFSIFAALKGGIKDNGWLETTYLDGDMRIGRGNKGTLFILTRDRAAVQP